MAHVILGYKPSMEDDLASSSDSFVLVLSATDSRPSQPIATIEAIVEVESFDQITDIAHSLLRLGASVQSVHSQREFGVIAAAILAAAFGVSGPSVQTAMACRDKWLQKSAARKSGVATTEFILLAEGASDPRRQSLPEKIFPAVVKPVMGGGTHGAARVASASELSAYLAAVGDDGPDCARLLEHEVRGTELHVDGWVRQGALGLTSVSRYRDPVLGIREGKLGVSISVHEEDQPELFADVVDAVQRTVSAMEYRDGVFHWEGFVTGDSRVIFSEMAIRPGGNYITDMVLLRHGVNLRTAALEIARGLAPMRPHVSLEPHVAGVLLQCAPGRLVTMMTEGELLALPGVRRARVTKQPGDLIRDFRLSSGRSLGYALCVAGSEEELLADVEVLNKTVAARCQVASDRVSAKEGM